MFEVENARCAAREGAAEARRAPTMAPNFQVKFLDSKFTKTGILDRKMRFWTLHFLSCCINIMSYLIFKNCEL